MAADDPFPAVRGQKTGVVQSDRIPSAIGHIHCRGAAPVHRNGIPGAAEEEPHGRMLIERAITVLSNAATSSSALVGLPSVDGHHEKVAFVLRNSEGRARLVAMNTEILILAGEVIG